MAARRGGGRRARGVVENASAAGEMVDAECEYGHTSGKSDAAVVREG